MITTKEKLEIIKESTLKCFGLTEEEFSSNSRKANLVSARKVFAYVARRSAFATFTYIAECVNVRHAAVVYYDNNVHQTRHLYEELDLALRQVESEYLVKVSENTGSLEVNICLARILKLKEETESEIIKLKQLLNN